MIGLHIECKVLERAECDSIKHILARNVLRWQEHIRKMDDARLPRQALSCELEQDRTTHGGQNKRYEDMAHVALKIVGIGHDR